MWSFSRGNYWRLVILKIWYLKILISSGKLTKWNCYQNQPTNQLTKQTNKETNNQTGNHEQWRQKEMLINYWYYTSLDNSVRRFPLRLKIDIANDWAIRPLDVILYYWDIFTSLFIIAPFTIVKLWKQPSSPSRNLCILVTFCLCDDETPGSKAT